MIKNTIKKILLLCALPILILSGCAIKPTTPACASHYATAIDNSLSGQANQFSGDLYDCQMRERMKTVATSALTGAAIGAALGAVAGKLTGLGAGVGAAIGAGVGGLGGAGYGLLAANRNDAADKVAISQKALGILQSENQNLANYIVQASTTIVDDDKKLADISKKLKHHKIKRAEAEQEAQKLNETKAVLQSSVANLKKRKEQATQSIPKDDEKFAAEMQRYNAQIGQLEQIAAQIPERRIEGGG